MKPKALPKVPVTDCRSIPGKSGLSAFSVQTGVFDSISVRSRGSTRRALSRGRDAIGGIPTRAVRDRHLGSRPRFIMSSRASPEAGRGLPPFRTCSHSSWQSDHGNGRCAAHEWLPMESGAWHR